MLEIIQEHHLHFLLIEYLIISFVSAYLAGIKTVLRYFMVALAGVFLYIEINLLSTIILWLALIYLTYISLRKIELALLFPSLAFLLAVFSNYVVGLFFTVFKLDYSLLLISVVINMTYLLLAVSLKSMFMRFEKKIRISTLFIWVAVALAVLTLISYFAIIVIERFQGHLSSMGQANAVFIIGYGVAFTIFLLMLLYSNQKEQSVKQKQQEMRYLEEYTTQLEKNNHEMRRFKHDYQNILLSIEEYIHQKDIEGLKEYFFSNIKESSKMINSNSFKLSALANLEIRELKSLLVNKLLISLDRGIDTEIEVSERIVELKGNMLSLIRALGIILDNAIEAAEQLPEAGIRVGIIKNETHTLIIVENTCVCDLPKLHVLKKEGFSTKGENRGLGLSNLERIIGSEKGITLDTKIENGLFTQALFIAD